MIKRVSTARKMIFILLIWSFLIWGGVGCQHIQSSDGPKGKETPSLDRQAEPETKEEKVIKQVYRIIYDDYVTSVTPLELIQSAVEGMQNLLGKDRLGYTKTGKALVIFSSGETIQAADVKYREQGLKELMKIYSFVLSNNAESDPLAIAYAGLKKMAMVDPGSSFFTPDMVKEGQEEARSRFVGIGLELTIKDGVLTVVAPIENAPALKAGIMPGDRISMIDGKPTRDLTLIESVKMLRGPKSSSLTVTIMREGFKNPQEFKVVRDEIPFRNVRYELLEKHYGYIKISQFQERTDVDFDRAIKTIEEQAKGNLKGLILDLRDNPGGLIDQPIKITDRFVESGVILSIEGRREDQYYKFYAHGPGTLPSYPMVVLVNQGSAAGSEIVAGALQDHKRAIILGSQTIGRGTVQTIYPLSDGSGLKLTTGVFFTPHGHKIEKKGISPDLTVTSKKAKPLSDSPPSDHNEIIADEDGKDIALRIATRILMRTASGRFQDLMKAAREIDVLEQRGEQTNAPAKE